MPHCLAGIPEKEDLAPRSKLLLQRVTASSAPPFWSATVQQRHGCRRRLRCGRGLRRPGHTSNTSRRPAGTQQGQEVQGTTGHRKAWGQGGVTRTDGAAHLPPRDCSPGVECSALKSGQETGGHSTPRQTDASSGNQASDSA